MAIAVKNTQKYISNFYFPFQFYWISLFCSNYFVQDCRFSLLEWVTPIYFAVSGKSTRKTFLPHLEQLFLLSKTQGNFVGFESGLLATYHCTHKNNDYNNKSIKDISSKFIISCKSIYLLGYFFRFLTNDSIISSSNYSDYSHNKL